MWNNFNSYTRYLTSPFRNGDVSETLSESSPLNFYNPPCASYLSILGVIRVILASVVCNLAKIATGYNDCDLE